MKRRNFIGKSLTVGAAAPLVITQSKSATKRQLLGHGEFQYELHTDWVDQHGPRHYPVLNCHEIVQAPDGRIFMLGDHAERQMLVFDDTGKIIDSWGTTYPGGHGLTLGGSESDPYLLLTDAGSVRVGGQWVKYSGRVAKTDLNGREIFTIGHPMTIGAYKPEWAFNPTETCVAPDGGFYVADGYGSDTILKYSAQGEYEFHFGGPEQNVPDEQLIKNAHGVVVDSRTSQGEPSLLVSSRQMNRLLRFDLQGKFIESYHFPGCLVNRPVIAGEHIFLTTLNTSSVLILDKDNKLISAPGATLPDAEKPESRIKAVARSPFTHCHDVCVTSSGDLLVCQWHSKQVYPWLLKRVS